MLPELLRHSSRPEAAEKFPEWLRAIHRPNDNVVRDDAPLGGIGVGGTGGKKSKADKGEARLTATSAAATLGTLSNDLWDFGELHTDIGGGAAGPSGISPDALLGDADDDEAFLASHGF